MILIFVTAITIVAQQTENQNKKSETPSDALTEAKRAIDKWNAQWITAWEKGDPAMIVDIFAEDGKMLAGSGKIFKGHQQILERQKAALQSLGRGVKVTVTTVNVWLDGNTAYETGKLSAGWQPDRQRGEYVTIWKRQKTAQGNCLWI